LAPEAALPLAQRARVLAELPTTKASLPPLVQIFGLPNVPGGVAFAELINAVGQATTVDVWQPVTQLPGTPTHPNDQIAHWHEESRQAVALWTSVLGPATPVATASTPGAHRLGRLQALTTTGAQQRGASDDSTRFIGGYGTARQVEALRDELLDLLAASAHSTTPLAPHDILVITPDLETFAPLIERHWGHESGAGPRLPFNFAERPQGNHRTRLDAADDFLTLLGTRVTVDQLRTFFANPAVAFATRLDVAGQDRLWELAKQSNVVFGTSPEQRADFRLLPPSASVPLATGTWQNLLDQVVAAEVFPASDVEGRGVSVGVASDVGTIAAMAPFLRVLESEAHVRNTNAAKRPLGEWLASAEEWVGTLLPSHKGDNTFEREVERFRDNVGQALLAIPVRYDDFCALWFRRPAVMTRPAVFGAGGVVVTGLTALQFAPYRVVALVGFDESNLPSASGGSHLPGPARPGDPHPRRAVLGSVLAAIVSARDYLFVTYRARSEDTGKEEHLAIPLTELRAALGAVSADGEGLRTVITSRHEVLLGPDEAPRESRDPQLRDIANGSLSVGIMNVRRPLTIENLDEGRNPTLGDVADALMSPSRYFLRSVLRVSLPEPWPAGPGGLAFGIDTNVARRLRARLLDEATNFVLANTALTSPVHLVAPSDEHDVHPIRRDDQLAKAFNEFWGDTFADAVRAESTIGLLPPSLWTQVIDRNEIALGAFTRAAELEMYRPARSVFGPHLSAGPFVFDTSAEAGVADQVRFPLYERVDEPEVYYLLATHDKKIEIGKNSTFPYWSFLDQLVGLAAVASQVGCGNARLRVVTPPKRLVPYKKGQDRRVKGDFAGAEWHEFFLDDGAQELLDEMAEILAALRQGPIPLFPKTMFAYNHQGMDGGIEAWEGEYGEGKRIANRILYPYEFGDLVAFEEEFARYAEVLRGWVERWRHASVSQSHSPLAHRTALHLGRPS
jgi:exonuclease V gamma subunit